jgi:hypothetical protein
MSVADHVRQRSESCPAAEWSPPSADTVLSCADMSPPVSGEEPVRLLERDQSCHWTSSATALGQTGVPSPNTEASAIPDSGIFLIQLAFLHSLKRQ